MTNLIDHIIETIILVGSNFILLELVEKIACVGQKINKIEPKNDL